VINGGRTRDIQDHNLALCQLSYDHRESFCACGIVVLLSQMMSNHHHTVLYDPEGQVNEFKEHFHKMVAKCQNVHRGRFENLWSSEPPCTVELMELSDVIDKLRWISGVGASRA
jgi:hypothetical protein